MFQTPSERGGIPLLPLEAGKPTVLGMFQTPSERGGIPLGFADSMSNRPRAPFQTPSERGGIPLPPRPGRSLCARLVSNPFIAGRDSSACKNLEATLGDGMFQTPSERGGIPLWFANCGPKVPPPRFKPLHSGAGFLWWRYLVMNGQELRRFKPLHSGAGFLCRAEDMVGYQILNVSNPFIAGRDSSAVGLHLAGRGAGCFKPLHSGAGFLWGAFSLARQSAFTCFKPLHSGAGFLCG